MAAQTIDGQALAAQVKAEAAAEAARLAAQGIVPHLVVFLVGEDPASAVYVRGKEKDCAACGIRSSVVRLPAETQQEDLLQQVKAAGADAGVHGILVQLPLPPHIDERAVIDALEPGKDVDGFTPLNVGRLHTGQTCFVPCTPAGCLHMIESTGVLLAGAAAMVVGRSNIVGKPMAALLTAQSATVTLCHSRTKNLAECCRAADILVVAAGRPGLVTAEMVRPGAVVIDVGINRGTDGRLHGDVDFAAVSAVAGWLTPVPGGVGPMTRAMLMRNTVRAAAAACPRNN